MRSLSANATSLPHAEDLWLAKSLYSPYEAHATLDTYRRISRPVLEPFVIV